MKALKTVILAMAASGILLAGGAQAENNLLGQLQQAANEGLNGAGKNTNSTGTTSSLTSLLGGGDSALTSTSANTRPDRPDLRDRIYDPPLVTLPSQYPPPKWVNTYLPKYRRRG